ncbi:MAG: thiamine pyrophosphate-binding protein [Gemmatimonadetes bacterium]|nr:thiamine pyrophosphate-binding protein [Gemmatimonadota bacterium]
MRAADYVMARLADEGVSHVFMLAGGGAMHLNDALACQPRLEAVPCHHEQACGIAAEANGRVQGADAAGFGVVVVTTGPGATNALTPVAGAWIESLPLLVLSGQVKRADLLAGRPLRQSGVQEVDVVAMVKPITKYAVTVESAERIRYHLERALYEMRNGRAGPVWIDIPLDVQAAQVDPTRLEGFTPPSDVAPSLDDTMRSLCALLAKAQRPLLLAGHGVRIGGAAALFRAVAEQLGIPVVTTWNALDLLPWEHDLLVGRPGVVALRAPNFAVQRCDLLITIGARLDNVVTGFDNRGFGGGAPKVIVDIDANELARQEGNVALAVVSDAHAFLSAWKSAPPVTHADWAPWRARCQDWKQRYGIGDGQPMGATGEISHYRFVDALSDALPPETLCVTGSSGLAVEVFYTVFRNKPGQRVFLTSGLGSMGYGLPAAIGACLGTRRQRTVCVEGDGSLMLNLQELSTLKALQLPIVLIVMNNGGYASIRNTQRNYFESRFIGTGAESGLVMPDLLKVCDAIGIPAMRITRAEDLAEGLAGALAQRGPYLCDVVLTSSETLAPKVAAIPRADGSMVSMPLEDMSPLLPIDVLQRELGHVSSRSVDARGAS